MIARCTEAKTKLAGMKELEKLKKKMLDKSNSLCYNKHRKQERKSSSGYLFKSPLPDTVTIVKRRSAEK